MHGTSAYLCVVRVRERLARQRLQQAVQLGGRGGGRRARAHAAQRAARPRQRLRDAHLAQRLQRRLPPRDERIIIIFKDSFRISISSMAQKEISFHFVTAISDIHFQESERPE